MSKFEYIKGNAKNKVSWFKSKGSLLNRWRDDFFKLKGIENYNFWVMGAIEVWDTWDTDITILVELKDLKELETIMTEAAKIGFKHRQLIDISWTDYPDKSDLLQDFKKLSLAYKKRDPSLAVTVERKIISMCSFVKKMENILFR